MSSWWFDCDDLILSIFNTLQSDSPSLLNAFGVFFLISTAIVKMLRIHIHLCLILIFISVDVFSFFVYSVLHVCSSTALCALLIVGLRLYFKRYWSFMSKINDEDEEWTMTFAVENCRMKSFHETCDTTTTGKKFFYRENHREIYRVAQKTKPLLKK